ncbi:MAG: cytidylate kinase-like family protein [Treponema sp.]|nr:cytidylate kinase-like family protein [Treponema sp.]
MAVIAISRQVAALGDEIASLAAEELGYTFFTKKKIEQRIVELGFSESKLKKYDEKKPGFFASLAKGRDEYLNYLQYAVIEAASSGNAILIGRGAFVILEGLQNLIPLRFVAKRDVQIKRLTDEFGWTEKQAIQRIEESRANRAGFHKSFFNINHEDPANFLLTLNTGILSERECVNAIKNMASHYITPQMEADGRNRLATMLKAQSLTNKLLFDHKLNINFLTVQIDDEGKNILLQGVADSQGVVDRALTLSSTIYPECTVKSSISIVQDMKK